MSASILDAVLANTAPKSGTAAPVIVSQQHDPDAINWVRGLTDPGEMIGCGMYQQLRRLANESDNAYLVRLRAELAKVPVDVRNKIVTAMKGAALKRASLDNSTGKIALMVAGEAPWHGLGVNVRDAVTSADAIRLAALNWEVKKTPLQFVNPVTGKVEDAPGCFGIVRGDTGKMIGDVGSQYTPFQNADGFAFLDSVIGEFGARYESAGAIYGGSKVWMLVHLPKQAFSVNGTDRVEPYALFSNSHDGTSAAKCFPTSQRVVCANTFRLAQKDSANGLSIRHTGNLKARVESAKVALGLAVKGMDEFKTTSEAMARAKVEPMAYFDGVLDAVLDVTAADALKGADALAAVLAVTESERREEAARFQRAINIRQVTIEDVLERYHSEKNGVNGMRGTAWAAFNAVTESANHGRLNGFYKGSDKASRKAEAVLTGAPDEVMQIAYTQAVAAMA